MSWCAIRALSASLWLVLLMLFVPGSAEAELRLFSLSIGYNQTPRPDLANLKYADDDALRNDQLMRLLGARSVLLTQMDPQSKALYPDAQATRPTLEALSAAITRLNQLIDQAAAQGHETALYLFYSGHGDVHQGEGYVQLDGGRLPRAELIKLLRRSHARINHVVIDACKSYFLVFKRGPGGKRRRATGAFLPPDKEIPRNTGFLLSTSSAQDSHEWEAYQSGIFSHEVRSALSGAADLDGDGRVTYEEAAAFIYTANKAVPNRRFRPRFLAHPHSRMKRSQATLVDLRRSTARRIVFKPPLRGRYYIEDQKGVRLVDLPPGKSSVSIHVPPGLTLFVRDPGSAREFEVTGEAPVVSLASLTPRSSTSRPRGAEHQSFKRLFAEPYDRKSLRAYKSRPPDFFEDLDQPSRPSKWLRPALGIFAAAALATGGVFTGLALHEQGKVEDHTSNLRRQEINSAIGRNNTVAVVSYLVGALAGAGYLTWTFWPRPETEIKISPGFTIQGQAGLEVSW